MGKGLDQTLAVLNGLVGDYLSRTSNGLATDMALYGRGVSGVRGVRESEPLTLNRAAFSNAYPNAGSRVVVLVHGLMTTELGWRFPDGSDYGSRLESELGYSALYVRYNTGLGIAENGARLSALLESMVQAYPRPIDELLLIGYSMGGLLVRSACHVARGVVHGVEPSGGQTSSWLGHVRRIIYVGTPHLGAPAERVGKVVAGILQAIPDPYTRLIADIGNLRSSGMKDLGHADLRDEDRLQPRNLWSLRDARHPLPLLPDIAHHLIAGSIGDPRGVFLFGDTLVPVASATFRDGNMDDLLPPERVRIIPNRNHLALQHDAAVYAAIREICQEA